MIFVTFGHMREKSFAMPFFYSHIIHMPKMKQVLLDILIVYKIFGYTEKEIFYIPKNKKGNPK